MALEVQAGDCVLFHTHLLHTTLGNTTQEHRRVMTVHVASARCKSVNNIQEFGYTLVRGRTFDGCLQPQQRHRSLKFV